MVVVCQPYAPVAFTPRECSWYSFPGWCGILMQAEALVLVDLSHGFYCSGSMCVGVTVWFGWGGVVSLCRLKH